MKRSEMVNIINRDLRAQSSGNCDMDGDRLLTIIKSFRISPVRYFCDFTGGYYDLFNEIEFSSLGINPMWEPENKVD